MTSCSRLWFVIHHASLSDAGKSQSRQKFTSCDVLVIVATSAFGLSVDFPDITSVTIYGCPADGLVYM